MKPLADAVGLWTLGLGACVIDDPVLGSGILRSSRSAVRRGRKAIAVLVKVEFEDLTSQPGNPDDQEHYIALSKLAEKGAAICSGT